MAADSKINPVSIALALIVAVGFYAGFKFIPVYWQAHKMENALGEVRFEASRVNLYENDPRADKLIDLMHQRADELGIDPRYREIYWSGRMDAMHVKYEVEVKLLFGKSKRLKFHKTQEIEGTLRD